MDGTKGAQDPTVRPTFEAFVAEKRRAYREYAELGARLAGGDSAAVLEVLSEARAGSVTRCGREGMVGPRAAEEIGVSVVRGGDVVGEHTVVYLGAGEQLHLSHRATDRDIFARGALRAARWLASEVRPARRYDMGDVLRTP